jgi:hypothetical protein
VPLLPTIKENEIMLFAGKWMEMELNILSELCQNRDASIKYFFFYVESMKVKGR